MVVAAAAVTRAKARDEGVDEDEDEYEDANEDDANRVVAAAVVVALLASGRTRALAWVSEEEGGTYG